MHNKIYNFIIALFFSSLGLTAQTQKTYQKTFPVDQHTKLRFETQNMDVTFKTWNRNEVSVNFTVDFKNYSEKEVKNIVDGISFSSSEEATLGNEKFLRIRSSSRASISRVSYQLKADNYIKLTNLGGTKSKANQYRTVADIQKEISKKSEGIKDLEGFIVTEKTQIPLKEIDDSSNKNILSIRSTYEVYIPKYMALNIVGANANIDFEGTFTNEIEASIKEGNLAADMLQNVKNNISLMNGTVKINEISGGYLAFKNVTNGLIGKVENANLLTEFSKITFGEITKNVEFRDFKSDFFIHNIDTNFTSIQMQCEYSDIKMFVDVEQPFYFEVVGNNAVITDGDLKIATEPNRDGKKSKMFSRGKKEGSSGKNTFKLDLVHGFVTLLHQK